MKCCIDGVTGSVRLCIDPKGDAKKAKADVAGAVVPDKWHLKELGAETDGVLTEPWFILTWNAEEAGCSGHACPVVHRSGRAREKGTIGCNFEVDSVVRARVKRAACRSWETRRVIIETGP